MGWLVVLDLRLGGEPAVTAAEPWPQVLCGHRETRLTGTWECVRPVGCDGAHRLVQLVTRPLEEGE